MARRVVQEMADVRHAKQASMLVFDGAGAAAFAHCEERASREGGSGMPPPILTGGESLPAGLEAVKKPGGSQPFRPSLAERLVITATGEVKMTLRRHNVSGDVAFLDWINFTVDASAFEWDKNSCDLSEQRIIVEASLRLESIFGFGITKQLPNGRNFYQRAYEIGRDWGFLAIGGQRGTVLVSLNGQGCTAAANGWEQRLYDWLTSLGEGLRPRLTRVDVAHDVYDGGYTVDKAKEDYEAGGAGCNGRMPVCEQRGDWYRPNGSGRTFYIAKRSNGKFARIYEKGKQLGDAQSEWVRVECEFKSVDRILPFDLLLNPGQYLAGAYPMFEWIKDKVARVQTIKKSVQATYKSTCVWLKRQCGNALAFVVEMEGSAEEAMKLLLPKNPRVPGKIDRSAPSIEQAGEPIHRLEKVEMSYDALMEMGASLI